MLAPKDLRLMLKLGICTKDTDMGDAFLHWNGLLNETVVHPKYIGQRKSVYQIVDEMTPAEKLALRDAVLGVTAVR